MSLKYGLNVKKAAPVPARKTVLDDDEESDEEQQNGGEAADGLEQITSFGGPPSALPSQKRPSGGLNNGPPIRPKDKPDDRRDISSVQAAQKHVHAAEEVDPTIFDYDSFLDAKTSVTEAKKSAARHDAIERKPKYINNLLDAAATRKQDQQVAREKFLQRERDAEGDEFADKEKFVTGAYKEQQAETRRLEEEEKRKAEVDEKRKRMLGGGMQGFYRGMMDQQEKSYQEALEAAAKMEQDDGVKEASAEEGKTDTELAAELKAKGVNVHINDEGQVTDKRELLSAGLNVASSGKSNAGARGSDHLRNSSSRPTHSAFNRDKNAARDAQRERQSKMMGEQLAVQAKRAREEEDEERVRLENAAKSTKTKEDVSDAKARYLARKAAKERGEG